MEKQSYQPLGARHDAGHSLGRTHPSGQAVVDGDLLAEALAPENAVAIGINQVYHEEVCNLDPSACALSGVPAVSLAGYPLAVLAATGPRV